MRKNIYLIISAVLLFAENSYSQTGTANENLWNKIKDKIEYKNSKVYSIDSTYLPNQTLKLMVGALMTPNYDTHIFFIDDNPLANWAHACRFVFVNTQNQEYSILKNNFPPNNLSQMIILFGNKEIKKGQLFNFDNIEKQTNLKTASSGNDYAVIFSGGSETRHRNDCAAFYSALKSKYGYTDDRICVLVGDGSNYGTVVNDYSATVSNLSTAFTTLSSTITTADRLVVFGMSHGGRDSGSDAFMCLQNNELLPDFILADEINKINASSIFVIIGSCESGGFVDNLSKDKRIIATACKYDESSYSTADNLYDEFNYHFISAILGKTPSGNMVNGDENGDGKVSIREAYYYAKAHDQTTESPQYNSRPALLGKTTTFNNNNATANLPSPITYNLNFYYGGDRSLCNPFKVNPTYFTYAWNASHGSPNVHQQYQFSYMEAESGLYPANQEGEGIFIGFKFFGGHKYSIALSGDDTYDGTIPSGYSNAVFLAAKAANGINGTTYTQCNKEKTASCTSSKTIYDSFGPDGIIPNRLAEVSSQPVYFNPDENFNQLWLYAYQRSLNTVGAVYLSNAAITDYGVSVPEIDEAKVYPPVTNPNMICCNQEIPATGGTPSKIIGTNIGGSFIWCVSSDNITWNDISGATGKDYQIASIVPPKYYKRKTAGGGGESNIITIKQASPSVDPNGFCSPGKQFESNSINWKISHGIPVYSTDYLNPAITLACNLGVSDGIYADYNFKKGLQYKLTFYLYTPDGRSASDALLHVKAVNGLHTHPGDRNIVNTTADQFEVMCPDLRPVANPTKITTLYTPSDSYTKIWIYPTRSSSWTTGYYFRIIKFAVMVETNPNVVGPITYTQTNSEEGKNINTSGAVMINSGASVSFIADESIILYPGFTAKLGSNFLANVANIYTECYISNEALIYNSNDILQYSDIMDSTFTIQTSMKNIDNGSENSKIIVYPNPNQGAFKVEISGISIILAVELIDLTGHILIRKENINTNLTDVNISNLPSGIYFIKVKSKDVIYTKRIIKN